MFSRRHPLEIKKQKIIVAAKSAPRTIHVYNEPSLDTQCLNSKSTRGQDAEGGLIERRTGTISKRKKFTKQHFCSPDFGQVDDVEHDEDVEEVLSRRTNPKRPRDAAYDRRVRSIEYFSTKGGGEFSFVHAAEIPLLDKSTRYEPVFDGLRKDFTVDLQYPSLSQRERYLLLKAANDSQGFDPIHDIVQVMHVVVKHYVPSSAKARFDNETTGFPQRLVRAVTKQSESGIKQVVEEWNAAITELSADGTILTMLEGMTRVDSFLAERIMNQTHARTVSLNLKWLHKYEAGTDNVYGELLPKFVSRILKDAGAKPNQVFVDLGSGVGNVVLQAALESGCESWGCEIMEKYCEVATLQQREYFARCRLWGLSSGDIQLEQGDFLVHKRIHETLKRADVVLVNNQVFSPKLNEGLTTLFLDLKDGCQIISLKSFVPSGHKISARNIHSPYNVLRVEEKEYFSNCVSWTDQGGKYFISTKDATALRRYHDDNE